MFADSFLAHRHVHNVLIIYKAPLHVHPDPSPSPYPRRQDTVLSASPDSTIRVWNVPTAQTVQLIRAHEGPVTGLSLHATGDYVLSCSSDEHWAFTDLRTGRVLTKVRGLDSLRD